MGQRRTDGTFRFLGGKLNSASSTKGRTLKVDNLLRLINDWEVQGGGLSEVGVNWGTYLSLVNLASWFKAELPDMRTHTAHKVHEKICHHQPGGTTTFSCRELAQYIKQQGIDHRGLGRWCSTFFLRRSSSLLLNGFGIQRGAPETAGRQHNLPATGAIYPKQQH
jgi:hypothetical protein